MPHWSGPCCGGGNVRNESDVAGHGSEAGGFDRLKGPEPTPDQMVEIQEQCQRLLDVLDSETLPTVATLKLQGHTNVEITKKMEVSVRAIERNLHIIRKQWSQELED